MKNLLVPSIKLFFLLSIFLMLFTEKSFGDLAPLGQRKYIIKQDRFSITTITQEQHDVAEFYLKDPDTTQSSDDSSLLFKTPRSPKKPKIAPAKPKYEPTRFSFAALKVNGKITDPRVKFERPTLSLRRADEPVSFDFYNKIFEEVQTQ